MQGNNTVEYNYKLFNKINELNAYLLGCFLTDGCTTYTSSRGTKRFQVKISGKDADWIEMIKNQISPERKLDSYNQITIYQTSKKEIVNWFISHGCIPNKSTVLKFPKIPKKYFRDFLRGCIDGDGSIYTTQSKWKNKNGEMKSSLRPLCRLCSASKQFTQEMAKQLKKHGLNFSIHELKPEKKKPQMLNGKIITAKHSLYTITFSGKNCHKLLKFIYYPTCKLYMQRKYNEAYKIMLENILHKTQ